MSHANASAVIIEPFNIHALNNLRFFLSLFFNFYFLFLRTNKDEKTSKEDRRSKTGALNSFDFSIVSK